VRSAKTWALIPKILALCKYAVKGMRVIGGVTKTTIKNNVLDDLFEIVGHGNYSYNAQSGDIYLFGVPWRVVGAKDEGSEKVIRGSTIGVYVGDELTLQAPSFVKMVLNRMSVEGARFYATTNPDTPFHYVATDLMGNALLKAKGMIEVIHFDIDDNPNLPAEYGAYLDSIYPPGSLYHQRFKLGLWVTGEGAIYKDVWNEDLLYQDTPWTMLNGKPGMVTPRGLRDPGSIAERAVAVDCGVDHVQVYLDVIDDGTTLWFDREYWWDSHITMRQKTELQYVKDLKEFLRKAPNAKVIIPPECASFDTALTQEGVWHVDADNEVLDGIKKTASLMALKRMRFRRAPEGYGYDSGTPIHDHVGEAVKQIQTYCWNPKASQRGLEEPLKLKDDGPDAMRYKIKTDIPDWRMAA
jgi:PBSX family phage terminase large subunit